MKLEEFNYILDESRIAQNPMKPRHNSRLLIVDRNSWKTEGKIFHEITNYLDENYVIVFNETKVIKARLKWFIILNDWRKKEVEIFLLSQKSLNTWECAVFPWERLKVGKIVYFSPLSTRGEGSKVRENPEIISKTTKNEERQDLKGTKIFVPYNSISLSAIWEGLDLSTDKQEVRKESKLFWTIKETTYSGRIIEFNLWWVEFLEEIDKIGEIPLPPYIEKNKQTIEEYNTVFAKEQWSAAAPTAGLHFSEELLEKLIKKWVKIEKIILHVWLGTFKTITTEIIENHEMHEERIFIDKDTSDRLNNYKKEWKRIIAVGTTVTRTLESFANESWELEHWEKNTNIFIYPWYEFKFIDELITNFHLPKSSLVILVSAFYDREKILKIYKEAQENNYRFFSFWDAMWIR